eukprot:CAMPEP_0114523088 /NCGR_PEP_ID=MMETSP0109-20121206/21100_1 /TAXON_ID=29199 /ORGANISM="Chlorarachnion reptans, Strain CCCM449" /LENGTH=734 /DNA_ID=CAMNT_0001704371 /DNA_START=269 /DNA_END=2473 /DNA_ORIENTATION=+
MTAEQKKPYMDMASYDQQRYTREAHQFNQEVARRHQQKMFTSAPESQPNTLSNPGYPQMRMRAEIRTSGIPSMRVNAMPNTYHDQSASSTPIQNFPHIHGQAQMTHSPFQNIPHMRASVHKRHPVSNAEQLNHRLGESYQQDNSSVQSRRATASISGLKSSSTQLLNAYGAEQLTRMLQLGMLIPQQLQEQQQTQQPQEQLQILQQPTQQQQILHRPQQVLQQQQPPQVLQQQQPPQVQQSPHEKQSQQQCRSQQQGQGQLQQNPSKHSLSQPQRQSEKQKQTRLLQPQRSQPLSQEFQKLPNVHSEVARVAVGAEGLGDPDVLMPLYLRSAKHLLSFAMSQRLNKLEQLEMTAGRRDLAEMENLVREINTCREQLTREEPDSFEAVLLSIRGSRKMTAANIPSIFISFTALSLSPLEELCGSIFEVALSWKRAGIRCTTRALLAMGSSSRGELVLGTLRPMSAALGSKVSIRFMRYIRSRTPFGDNPVSTKNQIMLDLWSMGLRLENKKELGTNMNVSVPNHIEKKEVSNSIEKKEELRDNSKNTTTVEQSERKDSYVSSLPPIPPGLLEKLMAESVPTVQDQANAEKLRMLAQQEELQNAKAISKKRQLEQDRDEEQSSKRKRAAVSNTQSTDAKIKDEGNDMDDSSTQNGPPKTAFDLMLEGELENSISERTPDEKISVPEGSKCANCEKIIGSSKPYYDEITRDLIYCGERCQKEDEQRILDEFIANSFL